MKKTFFYVGLGLVSMGLLCSCAENGVFSKLTKPFQKAADEVGKERTLSTKNRTIAVMDPSEERKLKIPF